MGGVRCRNAGLQLGYNAGFEQGKSGEPGGQHLIGNSVVLA
jgi:hypothetical protein